MSGRPRGGPDRVSLPRYIKRVGSRHLAHRLQSFGLPSKIPNVKNNAIRILCDKPIFTGLRGLPIDSPAKGSSHSKWARLHRKRNPTSRLEECRHALEYLQSCEESQPAPNFRNGWHQSRGGSVLFGNQERQQCSGQNSHHNCACEQTPLFTQQPQFGESLPAA
jgi:hypothetical protein